MLFRRNFLYVISGCAFYLDHNSKPEKSKYIRKSGLNADPKKIFDNYGSYIRKGGLQSVPKKTVKEHADNTQEIEILSFFRNVALIIWPTETQVQYLVT